MRELIGKIPTKDPNITYVVYLSELVRCLECEQQCHWVLRWSRSKKVEIPRRFSGTFATVAYMVLTMKRRRKVYPCAPMLNPKRCTVSIIRTGARKHISSRPNCERNAPVGRAGHIPFRGIADRCSLFGVKQTLKLTARVSANDRNADC